MIPPMVFRILHKNDIKTSLQRIKRPEKPIPEKDSFARTNTNEADAITYDDVVRQLFYDSARVQQMIR